MSPARRRVVSAFLAVIIGAQLYVVARQEMYWPFLRYGMFQWVATDEMQQVRLWGVREDGSERQLGIRYWWPIHDGNWWGIRQVQKQSQRAGEDTMCKLMAWYEKRRMARGGEDAAWPRLEGLRYYVGLWKLSPDLRGRGEPRERQLLLEVSRARCRRALAAAGAGA